VTRWRWQVGAILLAVVGVPLLLPFRDLLTHPSAWRAWTEADRLLLLARTSILLAAGTLALALPAGIVGAVLLYRTDLPWRGAFRFLTILTLFVPLPLFASGWQAALGSGGWLPLDAWNTLPPDDPDLLPGGPIWKPWARGLDAAIWVHAAAALPWVILIVGQGLLWVERDLEEDALTAAPSWRVLLRVTLPRSRAAIGVAAVWVVLSTITEITVTDMMMVRSFAEEVYTQFVRPEPGTAAATPQQVLARSVAISLPQVLLACALAGWAVQRWERTLPPPATVLSPPYEFRLGRARWLLLLVVLLVVGMLMGVPIVSLFWRAGLDGSPQAWSLSQVVRAVQGVLQAKERLVLDSLIAAALAGALTATLALVTCWLAVEGRWMRWLALGLAVAAWSLPAPLPGIGLKETIEYLMKAEDWITQRLGPAGTHPLRIGLYDGPSPLPVLWAYSVRFYPFALALLWPVMRSLPVELREAARVDGATPVQELRYVVWPLTARVWLRAALVVMVLALGELGASKLVATPGAETFAHEVFTRMHFGVKADLAALCLVVLGAVGVGGVLVALLSTLPSRIHRSPRR
jgi:iron(III) transport system permease protein